MINVIVTGASGMVGRGVLLESLDNSSVGKVLSIGRTHLGFDDPKLKELIISDFLNYRAVIDQLKGYDACYLCMGVSAGGMKEEQYRRLTYDYAHALATTLQKQNPKMCCIYVSGEGTDSTEKGRSMWARIKGKTENDLLTLGFAQAYMFRPGAIIPLRGIKSKTKAYQFMYDYFMWLIKIMKWIAPKSIVNTTQIGLAMINVSLKGYEKKIIRPADIIKLAS